MLLLQEKCYDLEGFCLCALLEGALTVGTCILLQKYFTCIIVQEFVLQNSFTKKTYIRCVSEGYLSALLTAEEVVLPRNNQRRPVYGLYKSHRGMGPIKDRSLPSSYSST